MASFTVYHIARNGHAVKDSLHARTMREARKLAHSRYDDVIKVKRTSGDNGLLIAAILGFVAIVVFCVLQG